MLKSDFDRDGFAIVRNAFSDEEVRELDREATSYCEMIAPGLPRGEVHFEDDGETIKSTFRLHERSDYFSKLAGDRRFGNLLNEIWPGHEMTLVNMALFVKADHSGSSAPMHQDNGFNFWDPVYGLTATVAIDASTPENGPLICHRGSHHLGLMPHQYSGVSGFSRTLETAIDEDAHPPVELCMQPGDIALHHENTVHRSEPNRSDRSRRQLGLFFNSERSVRDEVAYQAHLEKLKQINAA